jgi:UDP-N-acetylglucosamine acyltransferase
LGWLKAVRPGKTTRRGGLPGQGGPGGPRSKGTSIPVAALAQIHPTAVVSPDATIDPNVRIGPYTVIEGAVAIGADCVLDPYVHLVGPLAMGKGNRIGTGTVIGTDPQHLAYRGQPTRTEVGDHNTFREHVTVHRGSHVEGVTRIGSHNYFMAHSHVAHDCKVADHCTLANGALMAGHCELQDRVFMSGNTALHQFVRMGRLSLLTGLEGVSKDVVPFMTVKNRFTVLGVNIVGMRRDGFGAPDIVIARRAFHILYRSGLMLSQAVETLEAELGDRPVAAEIVKFIRESKRGVMRSVRDLPTEAEE